LRGRCHTKTIKGLESLLLQAPIRGGRSELFPPFCSGGPVSIIRCGGGGGGRGVWV